jgi:uncharacterized protein (DUF1697 family)
VRWIALLKAINVAGHQPVTMASLADAARAAGAADVRTLLASGNLVLSSASRSSTALESQLEQSFSTRLALTTDVFVRSADEWNAAIDANPFPNEALEDPSHVLLLSTKRAARARDVEALAEAIVGPERVLGEGKAVYMVYPAGIGRSKITTAVIERYLRMRVTARNWNTVLKLRAAVGA